MRSEAQQFFRHRRVQAHRGAQMLEPHAHAHRHRQRLDDLGRGVVDDVGAEHASLINDSMPVPAKRCSSETKRRTTTSMRSAVARLSLSARSGQRARASVSVKPTVAMAGSQNTAVGTVFMSGSRSIPFRPLPNRRSATYCPCAVATGVSCWVLLTSPTACTGTEVAVHGDTAARIERDACRVQPQPRSGWCAANGGQHALGTQHAWDVTGGVVGYVDGHAIAVDRIALHAHDIGVQHKVDAAAG